MSRITPLVLAALVITAGAGTALAATTQGSPKLSVHLPDNRVVADEETTLEVFLLNEANITQSGPPSEETRVTTARNVTVELEPGAAPVEILTATQPVGNVPEGRFGPIRFAVSVDEDAAPGSYAVPVEVSYNYTSEIDSSDPNDVEYKTIEKTIDRTVRVVVERRARFGEINATTSAMLGDSDQIAVAIENVGSATARNARVTLRSPDPSITFGGAPAAEIFVGEWGTDEVRVVTADARFADRSGIRHFPLVATVTFDDTDGETRSSDQLYVGVSPGPGVAQFPVLNSSTDLVVGGSGTVELSVVNTRDTAVTDTTVTVQSADQALSFIGRPGATTFVGSWEPGEARTITLPVQLVDGVDVRPYPLRVSVDYRDENGVSQQSRPVMVGVTPATGPGQFPVVNASADVAVGETGTIEVQVRNAGDRAVRDARVSLRSEDSALTFGSSPTASTFVGTWDPGEIRAIEVSARVADGADARSYPVSVSVQFEDADGATQQSKAATTGVTPRVEQSFALANVSSTLAVGDEGTIRATVTNTGPTTVRNAVMVFSADNSNVVPVETEFAVGDLAPGESATFSFDAEVSNSADAGPRQLSFVVRFRDASDDVRRSDPLDARVEVANRRDVFTVEPVTTDLAAGESGVFELRVTNNGDEVVTDVSAKVFADDPLSSDDDEAFIDRLQPGESTTVRFALTAAPGAVTQKVYPVSLDFQYEDAEGDTRLSESYDVPVRVTASEGGDGPPIVVVGAAVVAVLVLAGGVWYWRRR